MHTLTTRLPAAWRATSFTEMAKKFAQENSALLDNTRAVSALNPSEMFTVDAAFSSPQRYLT